MGKQLYSLPQKENSWCLLSIKKSLMAQWQRIHLSLQEMWVRSLILEWIAMPSSRGPSQSRG